MSQRNQDEKSTLETYASLLRNHPGFRYLFFGGLISSFGTWFSEVAVYIVLKRIHPGATLRSVYESTRQLTNFSVTLLTSSLQDSHDKRGLLWWADAVRIGCALGLLLVTGPGTLWILYVCTILSASMSAIFYPARSALVPELVGDELCGAANSLSGSVNMVGLAIGTSVGGFVTAASGVQVSFIVDGGSYLISLLFISALYRVTSNHASYAVVATDAENAEAQEVEETKIELELVETPLVRHRSGHPTAGGVAASDGLDLRQPTLLRAKTEPPTLGELNSTATVTEIEDHADRGNKDSFDDAAPPKGGCGDTMRRFGRDTKAGFTYIGAHGRLLTVAAALSVLKFGDSAADVFVVQLCMDRFDFGSGGAISIGISFAVIAVGVVLAPLLCDHFYIGSDGQAQLNVAVRLRVMRLAFVLLSLSYLAMALTPYFAVFQVANLGCGAGIGMAYSSGVTVLQTQAAPAFRGRVMSLYSSARAFTGAVGFMLSGVLIDQAGFSILEAQALISVVPVGIASVLLHRALQREVAD